MGEANVTTAVWAAPILPGQGEVWRRICQELMASRRREYVASRQELGILCEVAWLVPTVQGELAVICWRGANARRPRRQILVSDRPFDRWFRRELQKVLGPAQLRSFAGTQAERLYQWRAPAQQ